MDFSTALTAMKGGAQIARSGWNGKGMWIAVRMPTRKRERCECEPIRMTVPYIYMKTADDQLVPWLASQADLLANDWSVLP